MKFTEEQDILYKKLDPSTKVVIMQFVKVHKMEARLDKAYRELDSLVLTIPKPDMEAYTQLTAQIEKEE